MGFLPLIIPAVLAVAAIIRLRGAYQWWALAAVPFVTMALVLNIPGGRWNRLTDTEAALLVILALGGFFVVIYFPLLSLWGITTVVRARRRARPDGGRRDPGSVGAAATAAPAVPLGFPRSLSDGETGAIVLGLLLLGAPSVLYAPKVISEAVAVWKSARLPPGRPSGLAAIALAGPGRIDVASNDSTPLARGQPDTGPSMVGTFEGTMNTLHDPRGDDRSWRRIYEFDVAEPSVGISRARRGQLFVAMAADSGRPGSLLAAGSTGGVTCNDYSSGHFTASYSMTPDRGQYCADSGHIAFTGDDLNGFVDVDLYLTRLGAAPAPLAPPTLHVRGAFRVARDTMLLHHGGDTTATVRTEQVRHVLTPLTACLIGSHAANARRGYPSSLDAMIVDQKRACFPALARVVDNYGYSLTYEPRPDASKGAATSFQLAATPRWAGKGATILSDSRGLLVLVTSDDSPSQELSVLHGDLTTSRLLWVDAAVRHFMLDRGSARAPDSLSDAATVIDSAWGDDRFDRPRQGPRAHWLALTRARVPFRLDYARRADDSTQYSIAATCTQYGAECIRSYYRDYDGRVHATPEPRPATSDDPQVITGEEPYTRPDLRDWHLPGARHWHLP